MRVALGRRKSLIALNGLGTALARRREPTLLRSSCSLVFDPDGSELVLLLLLKGNRGIRLLFQLTLYLIHLVEGMKAVVAPFGLGKGYSHPGIDSHAGILDNHRQIQSLGLCVPQHLCPILTATTGAQGQTEQIAKVQIHAR